MRSENEGRQTSMAKVILKVTEELPNIYMRQITEDFILNYQQLAKTSKANSSEIYCASTGHNSTAASKFEVNNVEVLQRF